MIQIKNLSKSFVTPDGGKQIVYKDLSFDIPDGKILAISWTSGSGKSTLLYMLAGITEPDAGEIEVSWTSLHSLSYDQKTSFRGKNIAFVFQDFSLIDNLSVSENIDLVIDMNKLKRRYSTEEILKKVWLEHKKDEYPFRLSGGEQQRVAVARAFVWEVPFLFADEPTGNLDEKNTQNIIKLIQKLHKQTHNTIVFITHDTSIMKQADICYEIQNYSLIKQS